MWVVFKKIKLQKQSLLELFLQHFLILNFGFWLAYQNCFAAPSNEAATARVEAQQQFLQQERERLLREQQEPSPDVLLKQVATDKDERLLAEESPCFLVKQIHLVGDSASLFEWARSAADKTKSGEEDMATSRCLGAKSINLVMKRIQNAIVARGFVTTRVLAARQDIAGAGILNLTILPGRIRHIRFADNTSLRANQANAMAMHAGEILNLRDIEQSLENFQRVPTVDSDIKIIPAEGVDGKPGQSDLLITWKQRFPIRLGLSLDDGGSPSSGKYQGGLTLSLDNLFTLNDLFYLSVNHDLDAGPQRERGTRGYTFHYSIPYAYWLLSLSSSKNKYRQMVDGPYESFLYAGESENSEIKLARLIYRDARRKTTVSLGSVDVSHR